MNLMTMKKFEAVKEEGKDLPGPNLNATGGGIGITIDEEVDSSMADLFADVDDELFSEEKEQPGEVKDEATLPPAGEEEVLYDETIPTKPPVAELPPEQPQETTAAVQSEIPPQQPAAPPVQEQQPAATPEIPAQTPEEQRNAALAELEKYYTLSKEDADAMISEPETVLPRLASRLYLDIYSRVMQDIHRSMPQTIQTITARAQMAQKDESDFYGSWPALAEHKNEVQRIGMMYRQMNPQATKEQFIQDVGLQAMVALKLPLQPAAVQQTPQQPTNRNVPPAPPRGGPAVTPPGAPVHPGNDYQNLADEWGNDVW